MTAQRPERCHNCQRLIRPGESYHRAADNRVFCLECAGRGNGPEMLDTAGTKTGLVVEPDNGLLRVRRGTAVVEVYPGEVRSLIEALMAAEARSGGNPAGESQATQAPPTACSAAERQQAACDALLAMGVEPRTARHVASAYDPAEVLGWTAYAHQARGLDNPAAFVVARVTACEPAPVPREDSPQGRGDGPRFGQDEIGEYIEYQ